MANMNQVGSHKTSIYTDNGLTHVIYPNTAVVKFSSKKVLLDSGGYTTVTTKTRMNQTANQLGLGYYVYQKDFKWFVQLEDKVLPFEDGMKIIRNTED